MSTVYLLKNQHDHYLDKAGEWVNGENSKSLYRTAHKDEAINQKVEFTVKNFELRIKVAEVELSEKGTLQIDVAPAIQSIFDDEHHAVDNSTMDDNFTSNTEIGDNESIVMESSNDELMPDANHLTASVQNNDDDQKFAQGPDLVIEDQSDGPSSNASTSNATQPSSVS